MLNIPFYLTLMIGPVVPIPAPKIVMDALSGVTVTNNTQGPSGFQLEFTLSTHSLLHTLFVVTSGTAPLLRVLIIATVNGFPHVMMDGVTTKHQISGGQGGQATLTVTGEDLTKVMDLIKLNGVPYPAMPAEVRVLTILAKYAMYGIIPSPIPSLFPDIPIPIDRIPVQEGTDLAYIRQLAEEVGYVFYVDPGPIPGTSLAYWGPEIKFGLPQPGLNVDMNGYTNVDSMSFSYDTASYSMPIVFIQEKTTRVPIPIPIPNINPLQPPLGLIPPIPTNVTVLEDTARLSPMQAIMKGLAASARTGDVVSASGSLDVVRYGWVLKSRQLVGVRGAGVAFDGFYFVKSVTSTIKRGEFKQNFELTRNAIVSNTPVVLP